jgi:adenine phosphoribosyltransferase
MLVSELKRSIREVPDFPRPGINFYDVSTLFRSAEAFRTMVDRMVERYRGERIDALAGIEARGFVLAGAMAYALGVGLVLVRKTGKLPHEVETESYRLEYGTAEIEIHRDAVEPGQRVVVIDDVLATGGTAAAAARVFRRLGARVDGFGFMVELAFLDGRKQLDSADVFSLIRYD